MPRKPYVKHPRKDNTKRKCNIIYNRKEKRVYTPADVCRIAKYAVKTSSTEIVAAEVLRCLGQSSNICALVKFSAAALVLIDAIGTIGAAIAVTAALEKAYAILMGIAAKIPRLRLILAGLIVAVIFLRGVVDALSALVAQAAGVAVIIEDLQLICQLGTIDPVGTEVADDADESDGEE